MSRGLDEKLKIRVKWIIMQSYEYLQQYVPESYWKEEWIPRVPVPPCDGAPGAVAVRKLPAATRPRSGGRGSAGASSVPRAHKVCLSNAWMGSWTAGTINSRYLWDAEVWGWERRDMETSRMTPSLPQSCIARVWRGCCWVKVPWRCQRCQVFHVLSVRKAFFLNLKTSELNSPSCDNVGVTLEMQAPLSGSAWSLLKHKAVLLLPLKLFPCLLSVWAYLRWCLATSWFWIAPGLVCAFKFMLKFILSK